MLSSNERDILDAALDECSELYKPLAIDNSNCLPSGFEEINKLIGSCGYPKGGIVEIYGRESTGKTYIVLTCIAEAQKEGSVLFINTDYTFMDRYLDSFNIYRSKILVINPEDGEDLFNNFELLVRSGGISLVIIDSIAAILPPKGSDPIEHIKYVSNLVKRLAASVGKYNVVCLFTNHIREDGSKKGVSTGGHILKFYARLRLNTERTGKLILDKERILGEQIRINVIKNKIDKTKEQKNTKIDIYYK